MAHLSYLHSYVDFILREETEMPLSGKLLFVSNLICSGYLFSRYNVMLTCWEEKPSHRSSFDVLLDRLEHLLELEKVGNSTHFPYTVFK